MTKPLPPHEQDMLIAVLAAGRQDRMDPDEFAGREDELAWLGELLPIMALRGSKGLSTVIEGIPGIGKTSLASRFLLEAEKAGVVPVAVDADDLARPVNLAVRMAEAVLRTGTDEWAKPIRAKLDVPRGYKVSASVFGTGASFGRGGGMAPADRQHLFAEGSGVASALDILGVPDGVPFVVFIDEAHRLPLDAKRVVREFHSGVHGRSIAPIYAGMPWQSRAVIETFCSHRLAEKSTRRLGLMDGVEVQTSIWRTCRKMGVQTRVADVLARDLAAECRGFPRHIASAVGGVAAVERRLRAGKGTIRARDVRACVEIAAARRDDFYRGRLATVFESPDLKEEPPTELFAVLARAADSAGIDKDLAADDVRDDYERVLRRRRDRRDELEFDEFLSNCARVGVFEKRSGKDAEVRSLRIPTPSLVSFILRAASAPGGRPAEAPE